jgi:hypothetical protein
MFEYGYLRGISGRHVEKSPAEVKAPLAPIIIHV